MPAEYAPAAQGPDPVHLPASGRFAACTDALLASGTTSIAYETVQTADGALPLLAPMSEVAGRLAAQVGAYHLMRTHGGRGVLMGGVPGVEPADVVVIGGGTAGDNAARVASGMGAHVTVFDVNINTLRGLDAEFGGRDPAPATRRPTNLEDAVKRADLVIGAVLVPGAKAPKLVSNSTCRTHETGRGTGGHRDRPGRLLRGLAADHPRRPDLRGARHGVLLRGEHAQRGAEDVDVRADQRDDAVCAQARRPGLASGVPSRIPLWPKVFRRTTGALLSEQVATDLGLPFSRSRQA